MHFEDALRPAEVADTCVYRLSTSFVFARLRCYEHNRASRLYFLSKDYGSTAASWIVAELRSHPPSLKRLSANVGV
jgi:hypothetical protein